MESTIVSLLNTLNRKFYDGFAGAFADSRAASEPGLERVLAQMAPGAAVLDLGCGMGRVAALLPAGCAYTGMDFSAELLALAQSAAPQARFICADLLAPDWATLLPGDYDWIVLRAVLHHIPGYAHRLRILTQAARLLRPGGRILIANWQFLDSERLRRRLQDWSELGLTEAEVEPGDYLLDWRREGRGLRYVHLVDATETEQLVQEASLEIIEQFRADGHENNLTLYALLARAR